MPELKNISGIDTAVSETTNTLLKRKESLITELAPYVTGVVTEETEKAWAKDRAKLNKAKEATKKERTSMERTWKELLAPISDTYKEMDAEYQKALDNIDAQTKALNDKRECQKRAEIHKIFSEVEKPVEVSGWITIDEIWNPKWLNKSVKPETIRGEIETAFKNLEISYNVIKSLNNEWEKEGMEVLRVTKDVQKAINKMNLLTEQAKVIEEKRQEKKVEKFEDLPPVIDDLPFADLMNEPATETITVYSADAESIKEILTSYGYWFK